MFERLRNWITGRPSNDELTALLAKYTDAEVTCEEEAKLGGWVDKGWLPRDVWEGAKRARARRLDREKAARAQKAAETPSDNAAYHPPYQQMIVTDDVEDVYYDGGAARWNKFDGPREAVGGTVGHTSGLDRVRYDDIPEAQKVEEAPAPREVSKPAPDVAPPPREAVRDEAVYAPLPPSSPPPPPPSYDPPPSSDGGSSSSYDSGGSCGGSCGGSFD